MTHHERLITALDDLPRLNADELEAVHYLVLKHNMILRNLL